MGYRVVEGLPLPVWQCNIGASSPFTGLRGLQAADENSDQVCAVRRFQPTLTQCSHELGCGNRLEIRADQDPGDSPLHVYGLGKREQTRQLYQTFAIGKMIASERVEGANLRIGAVHARNSRGDAAKLSRIVDRA